MKITLTKLDEYYEFVTRRNYPEHQIWKKWGPGPDDQCTYLCHLINRYEKGDELSFPMHRSVQDFLTQLDMPLAVAALGEGYFE